MTIKPILILTIGFLMMVTTTLAENSKNNPIDWTSYNWGKVGLIQVADAPYPDDSRKDGFTASDGKVYPYKDHYDDNRVAVTFPKGYQPGKKINLIVIFHGHVNEAAKFTGNYSVGSVFASCSPNAILVVPQGPKNAPDSGGGKMEKPGKFAAMIQEIMDSLRKDKAIPADAKLGNIIIGGYSGGYRPMAFALHCGGITEQIKEVWLFDSAYDFQDYLAEPFTTPGHGKLLRALFTDHQTHEYLQVMNDISKSGNTVALILEEELATPQTTLEDYQKIKYHPAGSKPGIDEIDLILKKEPLVVFHTKLAHDVNLFTYRFLAPFINNSPNLK